MEPIGDRRGDMQAGIVAAALSNAWAKRRDGQPFTATDFMPDFAPGVKPSPDKKIEVESLTTEQQIGWLEMLNLVYGGEDLRWRQ